MEKLHSLEKMTASFENTDTMPALFVGHGNPMNAIAENEFVEGFREMGRELETPRAILCISAHWETMGTYVTAMDAPKTIHDFGGFPQALYEVQYPAPGNPALARETKEMVTKTEVGLDEEWGLDHGTWSVVRHMYPKAEIPVIQLSLDRSKPAQHHYDLAKQIAGLRRKGVLIIGSGNMVHNIRMRIPKGMGKNGADVHEWALEANEKMKEYINDGDHQSLIDYKKLGREFQLSIPTPEHYLPLIYALALKEDNEKITYFNDKVIGGAASMTSLRIGN